MSLVTGIVQSLADRLGDHYGSMPTARAAHAYREIAAPFTLVERNEKFEQVAESIYSFDDLFESHQKIDDLLISSIERFQIGNKVRIGQEAHVEEKIDGDRYAVLKTEAHNGEHQIEFGIFGREFVDDVTSERVNGVVGSVDHYIRQIADRLKQLLLRSYRFQQIVCILEERMRAAGFGESSKQTLIDGFEKDRIDFEIRLSLEFFVDGWKLRRELALASVYYYGDAIEIFLSSSAQFDELRYQRDRKIIDAEITEILERLYSSPLARTAQSRNKD